MIRVLLTYFFILTTAICFVKTVELAQGVNYKIISSVDVDYFSKDGASTQNMNEEENESNSSKHLKHASSSLLPLFIKNLSYNNFSYQFNTSHLKEVIVPPPDFV